jgi:hypothetical protein
MKYTLEQLAALCGLTIEEFVIKFPEVAKHAKQN